MLYFVALIEGSLEVKLPTIYGQMEKQRWEESEKRRAEERRSEKRKMRVREKVIKSRNTMFSNDLWLRRVEK